MPDPLESLRRPSSPVRPDARFVVSLRQRLEEELTMTGVATTIRTGHVTCVHVRVDNIRRTSAFLQDLFGWEVDPYEDGASTSHYVTNTSILTVLVEPPGPPVRLTFAPADIRDAAAELERIGGRILTEVAEDHVAAAEDDQGVPIGLWRPAPEYHEPDDRPMPSGEIGHVTIGVPDVERATRFYSRLLGWTYDEPFPEYPHAADAGISLGIRRDDGGPTIGLAWRVPDLADATATARQLGATVDEASTFATGRGAMCTDTDGNQFFLWEAGPGY